MEGVVEIAEMGVRSEWTFRIHSGCGESEVVDTACPGMLTAMESRNRAAALVHGKTALGRL
jgi:hypothetical protein